MLMFLLWCQCFAQTAEAETSEVSEMWKDTPLLGKYRPLDEAPSANDRQKLPAQVTQRNFFTGTPQTMSPFRYSWEYYRAWPYSGTAQPSSAASLAVVDAHFAKDSALMGTAPIRVEVLLCDRVQTTAIVRIAVDALLRQMNFDVAFPGWDDAGFVYATRSSFGEIFPDMPKLYEEVQVAIGVEKEWKEAIGFVTLIYQVGAGPRSSDKKSWAEKTNTLPAAKFVDQLRWRILNIIASAFSQHCQRTKEETLTNSPQDALNRLRENLSPEQFEAATDAANKKLPR
jgi:hypothetical protein